MSLCPDSREELHGDRGSYVVCGTDTIYDNIGLSNEQFDAVRADESTALCLLGQTHTVADTQSLQGSSARLL